MGTNVIKQSGRCRSENSVFIKEVYTDESENKEEQNLVHLKASLFSLWLPSIVGDDQSNTFLVSAVSTLVMKILILAVALTYSFLGAQQQIHPHPFLLWCEEEWDQEAVGNLTICTFNTFDPNFTPCFNSSIEGEQKLRLCGDNESTLRIGLFLALMVDGTMQRRFKTQPETKSVCREEST